ncbi:hypothetical protein HK099_005023 [Clydaea vesicula]|uniref:CCHC-type domain-containing protein n=1 Tax=Clydaea vesicula TaxID=447962 RepID=A0AAD5TZH1_9FUNG|nr:hypothetical protein HK099_005023 [Clydaea vesicula]
MTRATKAFHKKSYEEATKFEDFNVVGLKKKKNKEENSEDSVVAGKKRRFERPDKVVESEGVVKIKKPKVMSAEKREREKERRKIRRSKVKFDPKMTCFLCRKVGHSIKDCQLEKNNGKEKNKLVSEKPLAGVCYRCNSMEHSLKECKKKVDKSACPENEHGLYPNGGNCKYCGSVRHLAKDCKPDKDAIELGTIDATQGYNSLNIIKKIFFLNFSLNY